MFPFKGQMQEVHMAKGHKPKPAKEEISQYDIDRVLDQLLKLLKKEYGKLPKLQDLRHLENGIRGCLLEGYNAEEEKEEEDY